MNNRKKVFGLIMRSLVYSFLMLAVVVSYGCSQPSSAPSPAPAPTKVVSPPGWQKQWNQALEEAKKEGTLVIYNTWPSEVKSPITNLFKEKYGVGMEWVTGPAGELEQKLYSQRRAGLYQADVYLGGVGTPINGFIPNGILDPLDPLLLLPEVTSTQAWYQGALPFIDPGHRAISLAIAVKIPIEVNSEMVRPGEIASFRDLLNPKWKGKIVMFDPTIAGTANAWVTTVAESVMGLDFVKELARQEPVIVRDERQAVEWVARGKYPIFIGVRPDVVTVFRSEGAPVVGIIPSEGAWVQSGPGSMAVMNKPSHPNATTVFVNWILSKDGSTLYSKLSGLQSGRDDVPTDHLYTPEVRDPKMKYPNGDSMDNNLLRPKYRDIAKEVFSSSLK